MQNRRLLAVLPFLFVFGAMAGCAAPAPLPLPALHVGDTWTYQAGTNNVLAPTVMLVDIVAGTDVIRGEPAWRVERHVGTPEGIVGYTRWLRQSDFAEAQTRDDAHGNATYVYAPPCEVFKWPLVAGETRDGACGFLIGDGVSNTTFHVTVTAAAHTHVPAGDFSALEVISTDRSVPSFETRTWWAAGVCAPIRQESPLIGGGTIPYELVSYSCA
jgi:hypothetical protein